MPKIEFSLSEQQQALHELQFRDRVKSAQYHYSKSFEFGESILASLSGIIRTFCSLSKNFEFDSFKVGVSWPKIVGEEEKDGLRKSFQLKLTNAVALKLNKSKDFSNPDAEFLVDFNKKAVFLRVKPVYVFGYYCKYSREIAQTEYFCNKCRGKGCWYCKDTGHFCKESVEQLLGRIIVPKFKAKLMILHGAGREDMDVLMLGKGRPFIVEILAPKKRTGNLLELEEKINSKYKGKISVANLRFALPGEVSVVKDLLHDKIYDAFVVCDSGFDLPKIKLNEKIEVIQSTPARVAKRRADLERKKEVIVLEVEKISSREFIIKLRTSHGTYVKEFISGDEGRTKPSISSILGINCSCVLLDVVEICE